MICHSKGVNYRLLECGFISNDGDRTKFIDQMDELADGILSAFGIKSEAKKDVTTIAKKVIAGKWGNGATRKQKLEAAGYDYNAVQKRVNELL